MNQHQPSSGRAGSSTESGSGGIATKSHEAAETFERAVVEQAERVREKAESARTHTADRIRRISSQLQGVSNTLRDDDEMAARLAQQASRRIEQVARYVNDTDARALIRDTEQLARREPALFFGGAFLLGLAAGRFIKSSRPALEHSALREPSRVEPSAPSREGYEGERARPESMPAMTSSPSNTPSAAATPNAQRYRENFDATFARDPAARDSDSLDKQTQAGLGRAPGSPSTSRERDNGIGGMRTGKGSSP